MVRNNYIKRNTSFGVLILAGGISSRMKYPKARLPFLGQKDFLEQIVRAYCDYGVHKVVVVMNQKLISYYEKCLAQSCDKLVLIQNDQPEKGRMHSIKLGLPSLKEFEFNFLHNVDNPFVTSNTLTSLLNSDTKTYCRPKFHARGGHPILISDEIIEDICSSPDKSTLRDVLQKYQADEVEVNDISIVQNINTPMQYRRIFQRLIPSINTAYEL